MAEREAVPLEGQPDYGLEGRWDDPALDDAADDAATPVEFGYLRSDPAVNGLEPARAPDGFDAFEPSTWNFKPAPLPWYRTRGTLTALIAAGVAAAAIVVSAVLLLLRDSPAGTDEEPTPVPTSTSTVVTPSPTLRVGVPPAPPPPPPPPVQEAPQEPVYRPTQRPRTTKEPEIGVTRTPVTRSPISVAPQPRHPRN